MVGVETLQIFPYSFSSGLVVHFNAYECIFESRKRIRVISPHMDSGRFVVTSLLANT